MEAATKNSIQQLIPISLSAGAITFGLFSFMAYIINNDQIFSPIIEKTPIFGIAQLPKDSKVSIRDKQPPIPPPLIRQPPKSVVNPNIDDVTEIFVFNTPPIKVPTSGSGADLNKGFGSANSDASPVVQMTPKYPIKAATEGIEGWVKLMFNINKLGEVTHIEVLDSQPKRIFDKSAKQALSKWKYRAKKVDGLPVEQNNITVQLDFKMDKNQ